MARMICDRWIGYKISPFLLLLLLVDLWLVELWLLLVLRGLMLSIECTVLVKWLLGWLEAWIELWCVLVKLSEEILTWLLLLSEWSKLSRLLWLKGLLLLLMLMWIHIKVVEETISWLLLLLCEVLILWHERLVVWLLCRNLSLRLLLLLIHEPKS